MTVVAERYALEQLIAVGGMGEVWRGRDRVLDRVVAVKLLKAEYVADDVFLGRFRNEAKHTAALSHPGIANVFDYGETSDPSSGARTAYLVMEYVEGEPLSAILGREQRLSPERTLDYVGQAALALSAAHDLGVVHRDVKPGNLIVRPDGVVKVTDFGIARALDAAPVTQTGLVVGTAAYLSPEQAAGRPVTPASDVYALGLVAYECLAGRRAFDGDSAVVVATAQINNPPPGLPKDVPPLVSAFVLRALEKDPSRRQPDAGDFGRTALALATALRGDPPPQPEAMPVEAMPVAPAPPAAPAAAMPAPTKVVEVGTPDADAPQAAVAVAVDEAERRRIRNIFVAVGVAVVLLGFLLLRSCGGSAAPRKAAATPTPTPTPSASTVRVRAAELVGDPVASARATLRDAGFPVRVTWVETTRSPGSVIGVAPTGALTPGTTVTLVVATPPPPPPDGGKKKHGGHGDH